MRLITKTSTKYELAFDQAGANNNLAEHAAEGMDGEGPSVTSVGMSGITSDDFT